MQVKNMAREKKINPNAQAPRLIKKIQSDLGWVQEDLERVLGISQQAVSAYLGGRIAREQFAVIQKLENILAKKLPPPPTRAEEVINYERSNDSATSDSTKGRKGEVKKESAGPISTRGIARHQRRQR